MIGKECTYSVIIPLYNKEEYIAATLCSVLNQTYSNFEVIIVDDGSTDRSLDIVHSFNNPKIKVISKSNGGVSSARNTAITHASCNYLAFLDADDIWDSSYLEEMSKLIARFPDCGLYASAHKISEIDGLKLHGCNLSEGIVIDYFKEELLQQITRLSATIVPISAVKQVGGFPLNMVSGEDSYFCAKLAIHYKVAFTPIPLVIYNKGFSGIALRYGKMDKCTESWFDLLEDGNFYRNEFVAEKAIKAGIRYALGSHRAKSIEIEKLTQYTKYSKTEWRHLFLLNRFPYAGIKLLQQTKPLFKLIKKAMKKYDKSRLAVIK